VCERDWSDAHVTNSIVDVHADDPEFGCRFIADELEQAGRDLGEGREHLLHRHTGLVDHDPQRVVEVRARRRGRRSTTTSCSETSPPAALMRCG
jgi:hypothetical protein